jgi:indolepyruvate ferredoxin oxidoreductase beta subunit
MAKVAEDTGSVISAVLFGALAGTGVLPFSRAQFEATIERGGVGVRTSLEAFGVGFERTAASAGDMPRDAQATPQPVLGEPGDPQVRALLARVRAELPASVQSIAIEGVRRLIDYQDPGYAGLFLDRMSRIRRVAANDETLLADTARHLALWMSYEDTIRVADLKTRDTRFERVSSEVRAQGNQLLAINEYMHPRLQEICETLPAGLGRWLERSGAPRRLVERFTRQGRVVNTTSLRGFLLLYVLAGLKRWRRSTLRHAVENQRIERWLARIETTAKFNPQLALEVARCQRLVKGYSDTHERGVRNYETLMAAVDHAGARMAPAALRELRDAALADEHGNKLRTTLERYSLKEAAA